MLVPVVIAYTDSGYSYDFAEDWAVSALHFLNNELNKISSARDPVLLLLKNSVNNLWLTPISEEGFQEAVQTMIQRYNQQIAPQFGTATIIIEPTDIEYFHGPDDIKSIVENIIAEKYDL